MTQNGIICFKSLSVINTISLNQLLIVDEVSFQTEDLTATKWIYYIVCYCDVTM